MKKLTNVVSTKVIAAAVILATACNTGTSNNANSTGDSIGNSPGANTSGNIGGDSAGIVNTVPTNDANITMSDTGFLSKNIADNTVEIQLSKLARDKSTNPQIKKAATLMITDHTQILADMKLLANKKNAGTKGSSVIISDVNAMASLRTSTGKDFDNAWLGQMLTMHEEKMRELENALSQTQDADIKTAINKALPTIKIHRDLLAKLSSANTAAR